MQGLLSGFPSKQADTEANHGEAAEVGDLGEVTDRSCSVNFCIGSGPCYASGPRPSPTCGQGKKSGAGKTQDLSDLLVSKEVESTAEKSAAGDKHLEYWLKPCLEHLGTSHIGVPGFKTRILCF